MGRGQRKRKQSNGSKGNDDNFCFHGSMWFKIYLFFHPNSYRGVICFGFHYFFCARREGEANNKGKQGDVDKFFHDIFKLDDFKVLLFWDLNYYSFIPTPMGELSVLGFTTSSVQEENERQTTKASIAM